TDVRAEIAEKVNAEFSTTERPVNLDSTQIKNKIDSMKKLWKKANRNEPDIGDENSIEVPDEESSVGNMPLSSGTGKEAEIRSKALRNEMQWMQ
ncbi:hypothetical protein BGX31_001430, partial [Mortierella sp. GBA43]